MYEPVRVPCTTCEGSTATPSCCSVSRSREVASAPLGGGGGGGGSDGGGFSSGGSR
jgi:hypothetical protein